MIDRTHVRSALVWFALGLVPGSALAFDAVGQWETVPAAEPSPADAAPAKAAPAKAAKAARVGAGQFVVPLLENGKTSAFLLAEVTLEMDTAAHAARHRADKAPLRDIMLRQLFEAAHQGVVRQGVADPAALGEMLRGALNSELGGQIVSRVLFERLLLQDNIRG